MSPSAAARLVDPSLRPHQPLAMQIRRSASISKCGTYRWTLWREWGSEASSPDAGLILPWIMLNPSTADGALDDPTLRRIIGFSWRWGFDGVLVVNLYPFRSSKPAALREWLRWDERQDLDARDAIHQNRNRIAALLTPYDAAMAAWGSPAGSLGYEAELGAEGLLDAINNPESVHPPTTRKRVIELFCLGITGAGDPKHPMARGRHRVPDDARPQSVKRYPGTITAAPFEVPASRPIPRLFPDLPPTTGDQP